MDFLTIPSLLQSKLNNLDSKGNSELPLLVEIGKDITPIVVARALQLGLILKEESPKVTHQTINHPHILMLLDQPLLDYLENCEDNRIKSAFVLISESSLPKHDLGTLRQKGSVLATTPQRAIDHLRRDNLFLDSTSTVIVAYSFFEDDKTEEKLNSEANAFLDDCRFIFTKLSSKVRIELYTKSLQSLTRTPQQLFSNAKIVAQSDWEKLNQSLVLYVASKIAPKSVSEILYALGEKNYFIVHKSASRWYALKAKIEKAVIPLEVRGLGFDRLSNFKIKSPIEVETIVAVDLQKEQLLATIRHLNELQISFKQLVAIVEPKEAQIITASKETLLMNTELKLTPQANEVLAGKIKTLVDKLNIDPNPQDLENLKKTIKKNVPFYRRNYFSAYLLRELINNGTIKGVTKSPTREKRDNKTQVVANNSRTLYLNIGKMRRLYAKELSLIFQERLNINRSDIFAIRIYDKYSFVTLSEENAQRAIEILNGTEIRGRVVSVSYSNKE